MLEKIFRFVSRSESSATFGEFVIRLLKWFGIFGGGTMTAWAAAASSWMDSYGPIAWAAAGLIGALLIAFIIFLIARAANWWSERRLHDVYASAPRGLNPLETVFRNQRVNLADFESPFRTSYENRTFENCDIVGPATLLIYGHSSLTNSEFISCDMVELGNDKPITSAICFEHCVIRGCRLYKVTLLIVPGMKKVIDQETPGANWITA